MKTAQQTYVALGVFIPTMRSILLTILVEVICYEQYIRKTIF
jgi:hypothetical protein